MNRDNDQPSDQPLSYWEKERQNGTKPLVKEDPIEHRCQLISYWDKVTLSSLSIFNYTDTITDVLVTIDMFRKESFILGSSSLSLLLYVGVLVPLFLGVNKKWSTARILSALSFSSTQHYIYTEILRHSKTKLFSRRQGSRSSSQVYFTPIMSRINDAIFFEKITQNQVQLTLQLIFIAQTFSSPPLTMDDLTSWHYMGLLSFIFTVISLTRTCSSYEFYRHKLNPRLFNFYSIGRSLFICHPQYLLLLLVHLTLITSKALTLLYLVMIVDYNFAEGADAHSGACSLGSLLKKGLDSSCGFVVKVGFLIFLYQLLYYGVISVIALPRCLCLVWKDICELWRGGLCKIRSKLTETVNLMLFPFHLISSQRHFMSSRIFINHLPNAKLMTILVKIGPSILQLIGSAVFATCFYYLDLIAVNDNMQISFEFNNRNLPFIGLGVDFIHLLALTTWVFWADPQHLRTLADEKILALLFRMDTISDEIDVTCSRNARDVIKEMMSQNENLEINKDMIVEKIIELNLQLPASIPQRSTLVQKLRFKLKQAALNNSWVNRDDEMDYSKFLDEEE